MDQLIAPFFSTIQKQIGAKSIPDVAKIQSLWSGYGGIFRLSLTGAKVPSVIAKCITLEEKNDHPRGWATNRSHLRKLKSYEVETHWYQHYASTLPEGVKVPQLLYSERRDTLQVLVMEDLSVSYPVLKQLCTHNDAKAVIKWLAGFHGHFLSSAAEGLWPIGSYWHLATRPDEWDAMEDSPLKEKAEELDKVLSNARFQTIIHGDAKVANFCFGENEKIAAVDFQYVGKGVGVKDLAYFIGSCFTDEECELYEDSLLDYYFEQLLASTKNLSPQEQTALEHEWRTLYPLAWADFNRFLMGWLPGHQKLHKHALAKNELAIEFLNQKAK